MKSNTAIDFIQTQCGILELYVKPKNPKKGNRTYLNLINPKKKMSNKNQKYKPLSEKVEDCKKPEVLKINSFVERYLDEISFVWPTTIICHYTFWLEEGQRLSYALYVCDKRGCPIGKVGEIDFYPKRNIVKVNSCHESVLTFEEKYRQDLERKLQDFLDEQ